MEELSLDNSELSEEKLTDKFEDGLKLYDDLIIKKSTHTDAELEPDVKKCIKKFEDATKLVSAAGVFSSNETVDDISTESLKYLLLPAFLGILTLRLITGSRREIVQLSQIYLKDYLQRCKDYEITDINIPSPDEEKKPSNNTDLQAKMAMRDEKIKRHAREKELNQKINLLKAVIKSENIDESSKRDYYSTLIEYHIMKAVEELEFIKAELPLIEMMEQAKIANKKNVQKLKREPPPPMKPFIITKTAVQKQVFGLGYPSLPVYTVDEFYEKRVQDGDFPGHCNKPSTSIMTGNSNIETSEEEKKEQLLDDDDPVALQRARNMDEFRDDHKRGEGNRYNRS